MDSAGAVVEEAGARLHEGEVQADEDLLRRLLADQHPELAGRPVRRVASTGTDHAVFRLGDDLVVRMPRIAWAEQQVAREATWLPVLAGQLSVDVPVPVVVAEPGHGYPFRWLVSPWLEGRDLLERMGEDDDLDWLGLADDLAQFLGALQAVDGAGGPKPGKRGRDLAGRDPEVRALLPGLAAEIDVDAALGVWEAGLAAPAWPTPSVWAHGDLLPGNLVVDRRGRLTGVIDWGPTGVGDPACELMIAWSLPAEARAHLRAELDVDDATWARARGWVVEQAVPFIPYYEHTLPAAVAITRKRLAAALAE